jgi:lysophospholipid acyltransferase (LPLAT)-like uncharacterized protein
MQPFDDQQDRCSKQKPSVHAGTSGRNRLRQEPPIALDRVSAAVYVASSIVGATWRYVIDDPHGQMPHSSHSGGRIYCFWHEHLLMGFHRLRGHDLVALISPSRDGERLSSVLQRWGYALIRGSSSRKGLTSLRQSIRALKNDRDLVITPDGPRGPRRAAKPGTAQLALATGACVIPITVSARPAVRLSSWDRFVVPLPFARIRLRLSPPLYAQRMAEHDEPERALLELLEQGLNR